MPMNEIHQDRELTTEVDWLGAKLNPLSDGKAVVFSLISAKGTGKRKNPTIIITPGTAFDSGPRTVLVSVVNLGSCIVEIDCNSTANLVLAGIPARLAKALLDKLRFILREVSNGNSSPPRSRRTKRPSSGAAGFKPRPSSVTVVPRSAYRECRKPKL